MRTTVLLAAAAVAASLFAAPTAASADTGERQTHCYSFRSVDADQMRGPITLPFHPQGQEVRTIGEVGYDICVKNPRAGGQGKVWIKPRLLEATTVVTNLEDQTCRWTRGWRFNFRIHDDRDHTIKQRLRVDCDGDFHTSRTKRSIKGRDRLHWSKGNPPWWGAKVVGDHRFNPDSVKRIGGKLAVADLLRDAKKA